MRAATFSGGPQSRRENILLVPVETKNHVLFPQIRVVPVVVLIIVIPPMSLLDSGFQAVVPIVLRAIEVPVPVGCIAAIFLFPPALY
jgi:hypothetical protein